MTDFPKVPSLLPKNPSIRLGIVITVVGIVAYAMGAMMHSEIWHFFLSSLGGG